MTPVANRPGQAGFVLAVTLWILAAIAVVAAVVSLWARDGVGDAAEVRDRADDEAAMYGTTQTLLYLVATRDLTRAGLPLVPIDRAEYSKRMLEEFGALRHDPVGGELWLDDQPYQGLGDTTFSIQDEAGLLAVPWADPGSAQRLVDSDPSLAMQSARLRDTLLDYIDEDDQTRPLGAERAQYRASGREGPANRRLMTPLELHSVLGWDGLEPARIGRLQGLMTPYYLGAFNINTAPEAALAARIQGCPDMCRDIIAQRRQVPFVNSQDLQARTALSFEGDAATAFRFLADNVVRITVWGRSGEGRRLHVKLTPVADKASPWSILSVYPVSRISVADAVTTGSPLLAEAPPGSR